ncbi:STT3 subunit of Oligosaccharyl transferase [Pelagophyceae sp. CCMP2097]|nr:STT3 subunit of Oligosaccharyl transferase [Pelagophyceae sp. CCMP2097]
MQLTSVALWHALNRMRELGLLKWWTLAAAEISLNDVCCLVPAWFGVSATIFLSFLTGECSNSKSAAVASALIMAIVPAHLMRSVGGGYDNESVAMTAMCATFYLWCRSLRGDDYKGTFAEKAAKWRHSDTATVQTFVYGAFAGLAYLYMAAAWGGFTYVINVISLHVLVLCLVGRFTPKLHVAYTLLYAIGTFGAVHVPVVGWRPLKDLELLPPLLAFIGLQFLAMAEYYAARSDAGLRRRFVLRIYAAIALFVCLGVTGLVLWPRGYFGPLSSRVRGLFVKHTRTGNPLVDSVAEHQPASTQVGPFVVSFSAKVVNGPFTRPLETVTLQGLSLHSGQSISTSGRPL